MARSLTHLDPLTGLRGVAAYSVLTAHAIDGSFFYGGVSILHPFASRLAYFGMSLFFVLSGFVIQFNYGRSFRDERLSAATWRFFVARFARLYPLYAIGLFVSLRHIPDPVFGDNPAAIAAYATLTQSWVNMEMAIFPPDWSISTEWFFYLAFIPITFVVTALHRPVRALALFCLVSAIGLVSVFHFFGIPLQALVHRALWWNDKISAGEWGWIIYFCPLVRLLEFIAGMLAARAYTLLSASGRPAPAPAGGRAVLALCLAWCAASVVLRWIGQHQFLAPIQSNFLYAPALAPLLLLVCLYDTTLRRVLSSRPLLFLGEISYSVYIWSFFVQAALRGLLVSPVPSMLAYLNSSLKLLACAGVTTVFAYGSYRLIEVPSRRWLRAAARARSQSERLEC